MDNNFNPDKQHTLSKAAIISGTGLHTGVLVDMKLNLHIRVLEYSFTELIYRAHL